MSEPQARKPLLSVCIPAHNEQENIGKSIDAIAATLTAAGVPYEFVIANDNSTDGTGTVIQERMQRGQPITMVERKPPGGFGRAIRSCLENFHGDVVVVVMADLSDDPNDIVKYYHKINEGYDAVFGSRFMSGSVVKDYPRVKMIANRLGNKLIQLLFWTRHNDLTNAFKAYSADAIRSLMPLYASHFNLTIEISLGILNRKLKVASVPINWYGRTWGSAKFNIRTLGRRYLATMMKAWAERRFIHDDLMAEHGKTMAKIHHLANTEDLITTNVVDAHPGYGGSGLRRKQSGPSIQTDTA